MGNQRRLLERGQGSTTVRRAPRPGEGTVYSLNKYRETEGIKDATECKHTGYIKSALVKNPSDSENYDQYITVPGYSAVDANQQWAPKPTRVHYVTIYNNTSSQMEITLGPGESKSNVYTTSIVYDCKTLERGTPYKRNTRGDIRYGYRASNKGKIEITTDTKTFLVKT